MQFKNQQNSILGLEMCLLWQTLWLGGKGLMQSVYRCIQHHSSHVAMILILFSCTFLSHVLSLPLVGLCSAIDSRLDGDFFFLSGIFYHIWGKLVNV